MHKRPTPLGLLLVLSVLVAVPSFAVPAVGVTQAGAVVTFNTATPGTISSSVPITGLQVGETIIGIDYRPVNDVLFAVGSAGRIYTINPTTGVATFVAALSTALSGTSFGVDFNPTVDRIRIVSDADQNLRVVPDTGAVTTDTALQFAATDLNSASNPNVTSVAYTNSFRGATVTTLYGIDTNLDILVTQNPPNNGTLNTVGALGVNTSAIAGFDIQSSPGVDTGYAALQTGAGTSIYQINLATGGATLLGAVGGGATLVGFAVMPGVSDVPTLSITVMMLFAAALIAVGVWFVKR